MEQVAGLGALRMEQSVSKVGEQGRTSSELTTGRIKISIKMQICTRASSSHPGSCAAAVVSSCAHEYRGKSWVCGRCAMHYCVEPRPRLRGPAGLDGCNWLVPGSSGRCTFATSKSSATSLRPHMNGSARES
jgi:hypothetical protein